MPECPKTDSSWSIRNVLSSSNASEVQAWQRLTMLRSSLMLPVLLAAQCGCFEIECLFHFSTSADRLFQASRESITCKTIAINLSFYITLNE
jgi:hypothetical protein